MTSFSKNADAQRPELRSADVGLPELVLAGLDLVGLDLRRVAVIGTSGSGKSTFARRLAALRGVPHIELDALHWGPDWTSSPNFHSALQQAIEAEGWVLDGNYGKSRPMVWARATALIWLDYPFPVVFGRALRRTFRRILFREELWAGNRESLRKALCSRDSVLLWVLTTYGPHKREYPLLFQQPEYSHLQKLVLSSPREAEEFLRRVEGR